MNDIPSYTFIADLHGHSKESDGWANANDIPAWANRTRVDIVALTDHDQVSGVRRFVSAATHLYEQTGARVLALPGIEITSAAGDVVLVFTDQEEGLEYAGGYRAPTRRLNPFAYVPSVLKSYPSAIAIGVHPATPMVNALTLDGMLRLHDSIAEVGCADRYAVERYNAMSQMMSLILRQNRPVVEREIAELCTRAGVRQLANTDYHLPFQIGLGSTQFQMPELTGAALLESFKQGDYCISPVNRMRDSVVSVLGNGLGYLRYRTRKLLGQNFQVEP